jgi:phosphodiesterase/alkaline phosphatase D-like protein
MKWLLFIFILKIVRNEIIMGPIIGKVTETTARILIESNKIENLTIILQSGDQKIPLTKTVVNRGPTVFKFSNLTPGAKYLIYVPVCTLSTLIEAGSFRTLTGGTDLNLAVLSCNDRTNRDTGLWKNLAERVLDGAVDYVFHMGDQVYLDNNLWYASTDNIYSKVKELVKDGRFEEHVEEAREIIRQEYRDTFNMEYTKIVLSNAPNIMILDDHEVYNSFGFEPHYYNTSTFEHFFSEQCKQIYWEYQRQLREDIETSVEGEYFNLVLNDVSFFFTDYRAWKSWYYKTNPDYDDITTLLGKDQKEAFRQAFLGPRSHKAVWVSSIPVIMFSEDNHQHDKLDDDFMEHFMYKKDKELVELLDIIRESGKKALIVGGDLHAAGVSDIYYKGRPLLRQLLASGINQESTEDDTAVFWDDKLVEFQPIDNDYAAITKIRHYPNYAIINFTSVKYTMSIVISDYINIYETDYTESY